MGSHALLVDMATQLQAEQPKNQGSIPIKVGDFSLLHSITIICGAWPTSYPWAAEALSLDVKWS
jgi:hypothetical protein